MIVWRADNAPIIAWPARYNRLRNVLADMVVIE